MSARVPLAVVIALLLVPSLSGPASGAVVAVNLSNTTEASHSPSIGLNGATVLVIWKEHTPGPGAEVYLRRSANTGASWGAAVPLSSHSTTHETNCYDWAAMGRTVHVVWSREAGATGQVIYRRSRNDGVKWEPIQVLWTGGLSSCPKIAVSGGAAVYVIWRSGADVYLARSLSAGGGGFGAAQQISAGGNPQDWGILAFGPNVYVWWTTGATGEVYLRRSINGAATFGGIVNVSASAATSSRARLVADGPDVHVVYQESAGGAEEVFLRTSTDGGVTFGSAVNVSSTSRDSVEPRALLSGRLLVVAWMEWIGGVGPYDVLVRRSANGGATWDAIQNLSANGTSSTGQVITLAGTDVHAGWTDEPGNGDVFYRRSQTTGTAYEPAVNLSDNSGSSGGLQLISMGQDALAVWTDTNPGNMEILFARSTTAGFAAPVGGARSAHGAWAGDGPNPAVPDFSCPLRRSRASQPGSRPARACPGDR